MQVFHFLFSFPQTGFYKDVGLCLTEVSAGCEEGRHLYSVFTVLRVSASVAQRG